MNVVVEIELIYRLAGLQCYQQWKTRKYSLTSRIEKFMDFVNMNYDHEVTVVGSKKKKNRKHNLYCTYIFLKLYFTHISHFNPHLPHLHAYVLFT